MNAGILDADLLYNKDSRFPNLAAMKLSAYHNNAPLVLDYKEVKNYDKVYLCCVFSKVVFNDSRLQETIKKPNVEHGGSGFAFDENGDKYIDGDARAGELQNEIEHIMPNYHLYDDFVQGKIASGEKPNKYRYFTDYSIGFLTRKCGRRCEFCINKDKGAAEPHSPLSEFVDVSRPKLCFLDDNFFMCKYWRRLLKPVTESGKRFQFRQGLDERLLSPSHIKMLVEAKYDGDYLFAFDNIADADTITSKLDMWYRLYPNDTSRKKFYVFCGFDRAEKYGDEFWKRDIDEVFQRIMILTKYSAYPYIMRHQNHEKSPYKTIYTALAGWCNRPDLFRKMSFGEYCNYKGGNQLQAYAKHGRIWSKYLNIHIEPLAVWGEHTK